MEPNSLTIVQTIQICAAIISPFLVLIGWRVVYVNAKRIATRNESYALITRLIDKLLDLDRKCTEYWLERTNDGSSESWITKIGMEIKSIRTLLELLEAHHSFPEKSEIILKIRQSATLDAERVNSLSASERKTRRSKQAANISGAIQTIYGHYRTSNK